MVFMLKILMLTSFLDVCKTYSLTNGYHDTNMKMCKYLYIDKNTAKMSLNLKTLFIQNNFKINLNLNTFKTIESNCFESDLSFNEIHPDDPNFVFYGVDLSNNYLDDSQLESIINKNSVFKYYLNSIKYLNLSNNNLNFLNSKSLNNYLDNEINSMRDSVILEPNDPGSLLNRFFHLESLILDNNPRLSVNFRNFLSIFSKLKVLSLNHCSTGSSISKFSIEPFQLSYLSLVSNQITDEFLSNFSQMSVDILDLSGNELKNFKNIFENFDKLNRVNLEKNLLTTFDVTHVKQNLNELNLKYNLIFNTSQSKFYSNTTRINLKLLGNPLICDCNSIWLIKELENFKLNRQEQNPKFALLNRKKPKSNQNDSIRLVYRRSFEELSSHLYNLDQNSSELMKRQKRIKFNELKTRILDLDQLTCSFLTSSNYELNNLTENFYQGVKSDEFNSFIEYREKLISNTKSSDFICMYEDHCRPNECDCCDFVHCHCRSICPSKCRCYYDIDQSKNIIDCSALNLLDIDNERPIELATDVRFNSNNLKVIKSHSFFGFSNVKYLYLQNNKISYMENECFDDLKNSLKLINLANNDIKYLIGDEFYNFTSLEILILTNNPLKQIDKLDLFALWNVQKLKLVLMENANMSLESLITLESLTKKNSNAILKSDLKMLRTSTIRTTSTSRIFTISRTSRKTSLRNFITTRTNFENFLLTTENLTSNTTLIKIEKFPHINSPFYLLIFALMVSVFLISLLLIIFLLFKKSSYEKKRPQYLNYVPKLMDHNDYYQSDQLSLSEDSDSDMKKSKLFRSCHRKSTCSSDSCESTYDGQSNNDSVSVPVSRSIENFNIYVYFNIIDNDYVANHLLPLLKKCLTLIPDPKLILKPLKTYFVSQADTMSLDFSNESYSSYYSSIYNAKKQNNNVNAVLLVLSENFYGYRRQMNDSFVSIKYKTNPNLYSINTNLNTTYMTLSKSVDVCFKKAFRIHLDKSLSLSNRTSTVMTKKSKKPRDSLYMTTTNESQSSSFIDDMFNSNGFNEKLLEKLEKYLQYICLKSNTFSKSNFSYVDYTKR
ncbi:unnamed protein product [Brachionus calyciflorus]|uniref:Uncharacterized protein n=1 Tax=Brachionus calyciflorus TaxID=104777 RepID=A0A814FK75_9BILA|nr:unnamed protein product [Brachionus calyciflorus]